MRRLFRVVWRWFGGQSAQRDYRQVKDAVRDAANRRREPSTDSNPDGPLDFESHVRHRRLTEADLRRLRRQHASQFYFLFGCALFALAFGATTAFVAFGPALAALAVLLALLFLAHAAARSLRAWQIRERRLGSFGEWLRRPGTWFPPLFS